MSKQTQFIGFKNAQTFNEQIKDGSRVKVFRKDGSFIEAVKFQNAETVNNQDVCIINIQNQLMQIDVNSLYI